MNIIIFTYFSGLYLRSHTEQDPDRGKLAIVFRGRQVIDVSTEASRYGVVRGLDKKVAQRRCPKLELIEFNASKVTAIYDSIWRRLSDLTPLVEPLDYHQGYLDLTGCIREEESPEALMNSILSEFLFTYRVQMEWGGGQDSWIARIARNTNSFISPKEESEFFANTPVAQLELGQDIIKRLHRYKVRTIQDLMQVPRTFLMTQLELGDADLTSLLHRSKRSIAAAYPPPELEFTEDLPWGLEEEVLWACLKLSIQAAESLKSSNHRAHELYIEFRYERGLDSVVKKFDKSVQESDRIYASIIEQYRSRSSFTTMSIHIKLRKLVPAFKAQLNLLDRQEKDSADLAIGKLRTSLHSRYGPKSLMKGTEYLQRIPQRFAQLLCEEKGWKLP